MKTCFTLLAMSFCIVCTAAETNLVFTIDDGMLVAQNAKGEFKLNRLKVEAAKNTKECLPASEYPEGNWGNVTAGFQLSIKFETNVFASGTPVIATIILRNVTNSVLNYHAVGVLGRTSPVAVMVTDASGVNLPLKSSEIAVVSIRDVKLFPGTEQKFHEQINTIYSLPTNGLINAYAALKVGRRNNTEIQSAKVTVEIK